MTYKEQELHNALSNVLYKLSCLPISTKEFLGDELFDEVQVALYGCIDDEEDENTSD